jgi:hypothetical protein
MTPGFLIDALPFVDPGQSYATAATRVCGAADQADANVRNLLARLHAGALPATARPHSGVRVRAVLSAHQDRGQLVERPDEGVAVVGLSLGERA